MHIHPQENDLKKLGVFHKKYNDRLLDAGSLPLYGPSSKKKLTNCYMPSTDKTAQIKLTKKIISNDSDKVLETASISGGASWEAERLSRFYAKHVFNTAFDCTNSNIISKSPMQIMAQMNDQAVFACERVHDDPAATEIVAASILWRHEVPVPSIRPLAVRGYETETFLEFGTQLCTLNGFSLQWVMTAVTILERLATDPTGILVAATYGDNDRAASNFLGPMRFVEWLDVPATWDSLRLQCHRRAGRQGRGLRWFRPTARTVIAAADLFLDLCDRPHRTVTPRMREAGIPNITFSFDVDAFQIVRFDDLKRMTARVSHAQPDSPATLRRALDGRDIGEDFIQWTTS